MASEGWKRPDLTGGSVGRSRRGLLSVSIVVVGKAGIPALEKRS